MSQKKETLMYVENVSLYKILDSISLFGNFFICVLFVLQFQKVDMIIFNHGHKSTRAFTKYNGYLIFMILDG